MVAALTYADEYGKEWTKGTFSRYEIELRSSPHTKNEIYLNFLPALNSGKTKILDLPRLRQQLLALERTTSRGTGRDVVNHPNAGHDDLINACAGALVMAESADRRTVKWTCDYTGPPIDTDEPDQRMDFELHQRATQIRRGVRVNGVAPSWSEAVELARKDLDLAKRLYRPSKFSRHPSRKPAIKARHRKSRKHVGYRNDFRTRYPAPAI
jgi:hypothetical protein